jgi:hypothetical protein
VLHEIVTDGSIYFGTNAQPGDVNETGEFATAVATLWRWSGDDKFRDENYDFIKAGLTYITTTLDTNNDGWPEGAGMVEAPGLGAEKLDVAVYTIRALNDLAEMAQSKGDTATVNWARGKADTLKDKFEGDWWNASQGLYADSLALNHEVPTDPTATVVPGPSPTTQLQQLYWINATPMETNIAEVDHATTAFPTLESSIFTGTTGFYQEGQDLAQNITGSRKPPRSIPLSWRLRKRTTAGWMYRYGTSHSSPPNWIRNSLVPCPNSSTARITCTSRLSQAAPW